VDTGRAGTSNPCLKVCLSRAKRVDNDFSVSWFVSNRWEDHAERTFWLIIALQNGWSIGFTLLQVEALDRP